VAAAEAHVYSLGADKVLKLTYTVAAAAPAAAGAAAAEVTVTVRVEPKSSKKTVDWVDVTFGPAAATAPAGGPAEAALVPGRAPVGAAAGSVRLAAALKERLKGKNRAQKTVLTFTVAADSLASTLALPATVTYQVTGAKDTATLAAPLLLRSASLLVPTAVEAEAYRALMTTEGAAFTHAAATLPAAPAAAGAGASGGKTGEEVIGLVCAVLRTFAVARSPRHAILYARTAVGAHVTALLKVDDAGTGVSAIVKSVLPGHAAVLLADVTEALKEALAVAGGKDDE